MGVDIMRARKDPPHPRRQPERHDGKVQPVEGGVPGPRSPEAARQWGATYGRGPESGTDYEVTKQSTQRIRARHRLAQGPGNPRLRGPQPEEEPEDGKPRP